MENSPEKKGGNPVVAWFFRLFKGLVIGTGFIIPGVSGGVFAAIFGVYECMIRFLANIRKDFLKNVAFFLPIGIGGIVSIVLCSKVLGRLFESAEVPLVWFFIGCVIGTLPSLYSQAGVHGRKAKHFIILAISAVASFAFLFFIRGILETAAIPTDNFFVWLLGGALMGLGAIVPGLSPSNFLLYMNIYQPMMDKLGNFDLMTLIPVVAGALLCLLLLSKSFDKLFDKAYAGMYHFILGIILASTAMIVPLSGKILENGDVLSYSPTVIVVAAGACAAGVVLGFGMSLLEKKFKD